MRAFSDETVGGDATVGREGRGASAIPLIATAFLTLIMEALRARQADPVLAPAGTLSFSVRSLLHQLVAMWAMHVKFLDRPMVLLRVHSHRFRNPLPNDG
jgi:hypothetical protein